MQLPFNLLPELYAIARLDAAAAVPGWPAGAFVSVTRTRDELSIVCRDDAVPWPVRADRGWRCLSGEPRGGMVVPGRVRGGPRRWVGAHGVVAPHLLRVRECREESGMAM